MKKVYGWSLVVATLVATSAWGQGQAGSAAQPRATQGAGGAASDREAGQSREGAGQAGQGEARRGGGQAGAQGGAQADRQGGQRAGQQGGQRAAWADSQIAALLAAGNRNEIEISKFAQDKLQGDEAKEFAAMMIKEHTPVYQRMQQLASQRPQGAAQRTGGAENSSDAVGGAKRGAEGGDDAAETVRRPREGVAGAAGGQQRRGGGINWMAFHRELADQCLESTKEMLGEYEGIEFDKAYLGQQVVAHQEMHDKLTVLRKHASSELQPEIEQQLTSTKEHLDHVKKLMDVKKDKSSNSKARSE